MTRGREFSEQFPEAFLMEMVGGICLPGFLLFQKEVSAAYVSLSFPFLHVRESPEGIFSGEWI